MTPLSTFKNRHQMTDSKTQLFHARRGVRAGRPIITGRRRAGGRAAEIREIATFNWAPGDEEIAPLRLGSPSPMSRPRRFCFEVDHPQLLAIHLTCDSLAKCDELHRRARNNALNFCWMELLFVWLRELCEGDNEWRPVTTAPLIGCERLDRYFFGCRLVFFGASCGKTQCDVCQVLRTLRSETGATDFTSPYCLLENPGKQNGAVRTEVSNLNTYWARI